MNTDIRLSIGFWSHPKTIKLIRKLGLDGVRSLQILWIWSAQYRPDGKLSRMDADDIEIAADWHGEDGAFFNHCLGAWIDEANDGYVLHDWAEHNPWQAEAANRSEQARKNATAGWKKRRATMPPHDSAHADLMPPHDSAHAPLLSSPLLTSPNHSNQKKDRSCSELSRDSSKPVAPEVVVEPVINLPLNTGPEYPVTASELNTWQEIYPAVDVMQELRNMRGWLIGNPRRRKTKNGIRRFIQSWLSRAQDSGRNISPPIHAQQSTARPRAKPGEFDSERQIEIFKEVLRDLEGEDT